MKLLKKLQKNIPKTPSKKCDSSIDYSSRVLVDRPPKPPPRRKKGGAPNFNEVKLKPNNNQLESIKPKKKLNWTLTCNEENIFCNEVTVKVKEKNQ